MTDDLKRYTVTMQSVPGLYAQYGPGEIIVYARDDEDAIDRAFRELKRDAFPDRSRDMWRVVNVARRHD